MYTSVQIIATSHDLTPIGGLVMEIPLFQGNLGWWTVMIWPYTCEWPHVYRYDYIYISESPPETQEPPKSSVTVFASAEMRISKSKEHSENCGWDGTLHPPLQYTLYSLYSVYFLGYMKTVGSFNNLATPSFGPLSLCKIWQNFKLAVVQLSTECRNESLLAFRYKPRPQIEPNPTTQSPPLKSCKGRQATHYRTTQASRQPKPPN